jgi:hypothetical protein
MVRVKGETFVEEVDLAYLSICINKIITFNNSRRLVGILVMEIKLYKPSAVVIQYSNKAERTKGDSNDLSYINECFSIFLCEIFRLKEQVLI